MDKITHTFRYSILRKQQIFIFSGRNIPVFLVICFFAFIP